jgi:hypothetical protein
MRRLTSLVLAITAVACLPRAPLTGIEAVEIQHDASQASATIAATEGLEDAGLDVDRAGPGLSTAWRSTEPLGTRLAPSRRMAIRIRVDPGQIVVRPMAEECADGACRPVASLLPEEALLVQRAVASIRSRLDVVARVEDPPVATAPATVAVQRQAARDTARDPAPPTGQGPVAVSTRMGPSDVAAGYQVDAVLVNGSMISGRVVGVSTDGVTIEVVPGREIILWAGDLASLRVR